MLLFAAARSTRLAAVSVGVIGLLAAFVFRNAWLPSVISWTEPLTGKSSVGVNDRGRESQDAHGESSYEDHADGERVESLELSAQAMKNLGLTSEFLKPVATSTYFRTISVPAMIVERPGRSVIQVSTPMTGVITNVSAVQGSAVETGALLFQIRLTHEELVASQTDFVRALGELDVENRELKRLQAGVDSGVIPPRSVLERQYAKEKLEALLRAQREALRLHGLSERQVAQIEEQRRLLSELSVMVPSQEQPPTELKLADRSPFQPVSMALAADKEPELTQRSDKGKGTPLVVESLDVQRGQAVEQGGRLCSLTDYSRLYIEGRAFEQDSNIIGAAASRDWTVTALFADGQKIADLPIAFVSSEIDENARTLRFYVDLLNEVLRDKKDSDGYRFVSWKYKPGQRLQLLIPVEEWNDQIVLPVDAVAQEGAEFFVFQQNGRHFNRISVHVLHRDQSNVVIANDGAVFPGDILVQRNAHQMQMAVRNKAGGAVDPHAGHNH